MAWFGRVCLCLIIGVSFWRPFTPKNKLKLCIKFCGHVRFGQCNTMIEKKYSSCQFNFEEQRPGGMVLGVNACLRGVGCSSFLPTMRALACLASPSQNKAWPAWHGMVW